MLIIYLNNNNFKKILHLFNIYLHYYIITLLSRKL